VIGRRRRTNRRPGHIVLKSTDEIARMKRAGQIVALVLNRLGEAARPGVTTGELDRLAETVIRSFGGIPSFYGLYSYPANICVSINDEVVHGIPGDRTLDEGDLVSFDVGATVDGMIADAAASVGVGEVSEDVERLMRVTREALQKGIEQAVPGGCVADISRAVQEHVEAHGYSVVRKLVGHGVGHVMHEPPQIPNFVEGSVADSPELLPGMTLAIEPMVNQGGCEVVQDDDGWTYRTKDGSLSAHFEHTIAITEQGCETLTVRAPGGRTVGAVERRSAVLGGQS
jgi:methionyl aminopeptidase